MKILFITSNLFPVPNVKGGAVETLLTDLINVNEELQEAEIFIGTRYDPLAEEKSQKYQHAHFLWYDKKNDNRLLWLWRVARYRSAAVFGESVCKYYYSEQLYQSALKEDYDLIVAEEGDPFSLDAFSKAFGRRRMAAHVHSSWPANEKFHSIYGSVITPSRFTLNALMDGRWQDYQKNGYVVHNCIDEQQFHPSMPDEEKKRLKKKLGIPEDHFVLFFAGRIIPSKGVLELVRAMSQLKGCTLLIAGAALFHSENKRDAYARKVYEEASRNPDIIETGLIPYQQIQNYYEIADAVVTPTTSRESCCLANLEGMLMWKPVISTFDGAVPEYIQDGRNGILMKTDHLTENIAAAVRRLQGDPELAENISANNLKDAQKYYRINYYRSMMDALGNIIKKNGRSI